MAREAYKGNVMISSKCPYFCGALVFLRIPVGYRLAHGTCPGCRKPVHTYCFDSYVMAGHTSITEGVYVIH